jgi:UPF0716 protein FxsA
MLGRLFLLLTVATMAELLLLLKLAQLTSFGVTVGIVLVTAFLGAWLLRREGLRTLVRVQRELAEGRVPADALLDGLCIVVAGAFLMTPGVLTDAAGLLLLAPPVRAVIKARLVERARGWVTSGSVRVVTLDSGFGAGGFGAGGFGPGGFGPGFGGGAPGPDGLGARRSPGTSRPGRDADVVLEGEIVDP